MVIRNFPENPLGEGKVQNDGVIVGTVNLNAIPGEGAWLAENLQTGKTSRFDSATAAYQWIDSQFQ